MVGKISSIFYSSLCGILEKFGYNIFMFKKPKVDGELLSMTNLKSFGIMTWTRIVMYNEIAKYLEEHKQSITYTGKKAFEIGGCEGTLKRIMISLGVDYSVAPEFPNVDIQNLSYPDSSFDFFIADQVLEHVEKPWVAVAEIHRVLKQNGLAIVTAPFIHAYHEAAGFKDYWRYTPMAWKVLFSDFDVLVSDGWGNSEAVRLGWQNSDVGISLPSTANINEAIAKGILERNDRINFIVTWCIARKL